MFEIQISINNLSKVYDNGFSQAHSWQYNPEVVDQ